MSATRHTYADLELPQQQRREQLAERDLDPGANDPTQTTTVAKRYAQTLRGRLAKINAALREGLRSDDVLGLRDSSPAADMLAEYDPVAPPDQTHADPGRTVRRLTAWLDGELEGGVLAVAEGHNEYVREAYDRGIRHADRELERQTLADEQLAAGPRRGRADPGVEQLQAQPDLPGRAEIHRRALASLETRNLEELRGITDRLSQETSRELLEAIDAGASPTGAARGVSERVDKTGKHRVTQLARTEIPRAHNAAVINRVEQTRGARGRLELVVSTAGDRRVCPDCAGRAGETRTVQAWRGDRPPWHVNCRCALVPASTGGRMR